MMRKLFVVWAVAGASLAAQGQPYQVEGPKSLFRIDVGKTGMFSSMAGHAHEVETRAIEGTIHYDAEAIAKSSVHLRVEAASLRVTGKGEPPDDVPKVQDIMLSDKVLDVRRYPSITFDSTSVTQSAAGRGTLSVTGKLTLHNVTKTITVAVTIRPEADTLTASGQATIKQSDFGISPISVGGVVKVKDALGISFTIVAHK